MLSPPPEVLNRLKALIHCGKKDLNLSEVEYRALLSGVTGKDSCKDMDLADLNLVHATLVKRGFKSRGIAPKGKREFVNSPEQKKIWKLWYLLRDHGKSDGSAKGLNAFLKKQTGIEKIEWLTDSKDCDKVIEGLKAWCRREKIKVD